MKSSATQNFIALVVAGCVPAAGTSPAPSLALAVGLPARPGRLRVTIFGAFGGVLYA